MVALRPKNQGGMNMKLNVCRFTNGAQVTINRNCLMACHGERVAGLLSNSYVTMTKNLEK
jgi:hypothetical protein